MDPMTRDDLAALMAHARFPAVSLHMPTHRTMPETLQDPIRFRNLLRAAEERLVAAGLRAPEARRLLEPARTLADDTTFWTHLADGLALFVAPALERHWRLPLPLEESVAVGERFRIKPLLPLFTADGAFHVLALSQNEVRLLSGTRWSVDEVNLEGVPRSLAEALRHDEPEKQTAPAHGGPARHRPGRGHLPRPRRARRRPEGPPAALFPPHRRRAPGVPARSAGPAGAGGRRVPLPHLPRGQRLFPSAPRGSGRESRGALRRGPPPPGVGAGAAARGAGPGGGPGPLPPARRHGAGLAGPRGGVACRAARSRGRAAGGGGSGPCPRLTSATRGRVSGAAGRPLCPASIAPRKRSR